MEQEDVRNIPRAERIRPAIRIVVDPKVIQGAVWGGRSSTTVIDAWLEERVHLCVTEHIMRGYFQTLSRLQSTALLETVLQRLREGRGVRAFMVQAEGGPPEDELFRCAQLSDSVAVVTHDANLLDLVQLGGIAMVSPGAFVYRLLGPDAPASPRQHGASPLRSDPSNG